MNTEQQIEFDKIKELWSALAITKDAKEKIAETGVILNELELRKQLRDTTNAKEMIEKLGAPPLLGLERLLGQKLLPIQSLHTRQKGRRFRLGPNYQASPNCLE